MTNLPFLFALAAVLAAMLASIAIWAPRGLLVRAGAVACAVLTSVNCTDGDDNRGSPEK